MPPRTWETPADARFNSKMVQLKEFCGVYSSPGNMFQFQNGTIKSPEPGHMP